MPINLNVAQDEAPVMKDFILSLILPHTALSTTILRRYSTNFFFPRTLQQGFLKHKQIENHLGEV